MQPDLRSDRVELVSVSLRLASADPQVPRGTAVSGELGERSEQAIAAALATDSKR
jgi:hypothetical protein